MGATINLQSLCIGSKTVFTVVMANQYGNFCHTAKKKSCEKIYTDVIIYT